MYERYSIPDVVEKALSGKPSERSIEQVAHMVLDWWIDRVELAVQAEALNDEVLFLENLHALPDPRA